MRVKKRVGGVKMSVMDGTIGEARRMSDYLLTREFRGPGDTIEAAAYRAEKKWGAPASILKRLRHRAVKDMLLSNWIQLRDAYEAACTAAERAADHQELLNRGAGIDATNSRMAAMAAALGGKTGEVT